MTVTGVPVDTQLELLVKMLDSNGAPVASLAYNTNSPDFRIVHVPADGSTPTAVAITLANSGNYLWTELGDGYYTIRVPASGGTAGAMNNVKGAIWASGKFSTTVDAISYPVAAIDVAPAASLAALLALSDDTKGLKADLDYVRGLTINEPVGNRMDSRVGAVADNALTAAAAAADIGTELATATQAYQGPHSGTAQAGAATTITLAAGASAVDNAYQNHLVFITGGQGRGQYRVITGYVGSTKVATVAEAWDTNPNNTSRYAVLRLS